MLAQLETTTEYGLPEGYVLRGATLDDLPEAVEMFNAYSRQLIGADEVTLESYRHEWEIPILESAGRCEGGHRARRIDRRLPGTVGFV